jgi:tetratricopeptide (TPR) repeat protein
MQEPPKIRVVSGRTAKSGGGRRAFPVLPAILGAVAFTIILAIAGWFLLRESSPPPSATPAAVAVDSRVEAEERLRMATEAIAQREWDRALGYLDAAAGLQPDLAGIEDARNRARDEKRHASFLGAARKSIEAGSLDEAVGLLGSIGESSVYHKEARELGESLQTAAIQEEVKAVRSLVDAGSHAQARDALVLLLQEHPESADVIALKADMEKAGIIREPRAAPAASPSPPRQAAPSKGSRADLKTALAGYRSGDFSQSSAALRELGGRLRGGDADKAISLADHVDRFGASLTSGREALAGKRLDRAEQDLMQALRLDREIESHYQASIREMLGDTFRGRAAQALQNADYAKARLSATRAMSYRPDDERSRQILDRCEAVARGLFDEARSAASAGRRDEARDKARQVMNILGDHPLSEQARAFIQ